MAAAVRGFNRSNRCRRSCGRETELTGPQHFDGVLPQPKATAGYYRDIIVQAFPSVANDHLPGFETKAAFQSRGHRPPAAADAAPPRVVSREKTLQT